MIVDRKTLIWDGLVRLFHLLFAIGFLAAFLFAKVLCEDSAAFPYHMILGLTVGLMAVLRIFWLFVGTKWARITGLSLNPIELAEYMGSVFRKEAKEFAGHNPATSYTLIFMLILALGLAFTGYAYTQGNEAFEDIHPILANLFLLTVLFHVGGVAMHAFIRRDGIVLGMIDGKKAVPESEGISKGTPLAAGLFIAATLFFMGSLFLSFNPSAGTTRWPYSGQIIKLSENEGGSFGEGGGDHEEYDFDD